MLGPGCHFVGAKKYNKLQDDEDEASYVKMSSHSAALTVANFANLPDLVPSVIKFQRVVRNRVEIWEAQSGVPRLKESTNYNTQAYFRATGFRQSRIQRWQTHWECVNLDVFGFSSDPNNPVVTAIRLCVNAQQVRAEMRVEDNQVHLDLLLRVSVNVTEIASEKVRPELRLLLDHVYPACDIERCSNLLAVQEAFNPVRLYLDVRRPIQEVSAALYKSMQHPALVHELRPYQVRHKTNHANV